MSGIVELNMCYFFYRDYLVLMFIYNDRKLFTRCTRKNPYVEAADSFFNTALEEYALKMQNPVLLQ